jgi:hypothetical protein
LHETGQDVIPYLLIFRKVCQLKHCFCRQHAVIVCMATQKIRPNQFEILNSIDVRIITVTKSEITFWRRFPVKMSSIITRLSRWEIGFNLSKTSQLVTFIDNVPIAGNHIYRSKISKARTILCKLIRSKDVNRIQYFKSCNEKYLCVYI